MAAALMVLLGNGFTVAAQSDGTDKPTGTDPNYVIGPDDRLRITVWNQEDISGEYTVQRDETFSFPLIGRVNASGLTLGELEVELRRLLADGFYKNPQVTAAVIESRSRSIFVLGELRQPGTYPITSEIRLIEAISKAGSTTPAAADHVLIIRSKTAHGPVLPGEDASAEVTRVDLRRLSGGQLSSDVMVRDGDTVFVPRASNVYVYGQVRRPGSYAIGQDTTVRQVLSLAGGLSDYGAANRIKILRLVDGEERELKAKLNDPVLSGDTVVVPERYF
ncbi:MAG: polysaccharide biosynthesis/export family protein [Vicinamibacterales bacterium]